MEYGSYASLEELLRDEGASEFRAIACEIPVTLTKQALSEWSGPGWSGEYQSAFAAFKKLVESETDYDSAMAQVKGLQQKLRSGDHVQDQAQEPVPEPAEAAAEVMRAITVAAIERLREQYPDVAAKFTPEQIQAAAMNATAAAVNQAGQ